MNFFIDGISIAVTKWPKYFVTGNVLISRDSFSTPTGKACKPFEDGAQ